uniref:Uncharacterized protein n=1 Tax=Strigamia maritima TaxID=126957 RepID=T1IUV2_STRMM
MSCWRWTFSFDELFYNATTRSLTYNLSGQVYELGNYNTSTADHIVLCIPPSLDPEYYFFDVITVCTCSFSILYLMAAFVLHLTSSSRTKVGHDVKPIILISSVNSVLGDPAGMRNDWLIQVFGLGGDAVFNFVNLLFSILTVINVRKARRSIGNLNASGINKSILRIGMNILIISGFSFICGLISRSLREINYLLPL